MGLGALQHRLIFLVALPFVRSLDQTAVFYDSFLPFPGLMKIDKTLYFVCIGKVSVLGASQGPGIETGGTVCFLTAAIFGQHC